MARPTVALLEDPHTAVRLLEGLAVLFEGEIGVLFEVRSQPPFERCAFYGGPSGDRLWL